MLEGAAYRAEQASLLAASTAWLTAGLMRTNKLPPLKKLIGRGGGKARRQTVEQQALLIRTLHMQLGGTLTSG